jgi:hypothetical protein
VPLLDHILALLAAKDLRDEQRFEAQSSAIAAALLAAEKAVTKAETATERRFEGVNEFRQTLSDQAATFISRVEFEGQRDGSAERIRELTGRLDKIEGRSTGIGAGWAYLVGAVAVIGVLVTIFVALH